MTNLKYKTLLKNRRTVGIERTTVEYLPQGGDGWQFEPIDHNDSMKLTSPPPFIDTMPRPFISDWARGEDLG